VAIAGAEYFWKQQGPQAINYVLHSQDSRLSSSVKKNVACRSFDAVVAWTSPACVNWSYFRLDDPGNGAVAFGYSRWKEVKPDGECTKFEGEEGGNQEVGVNQEVVVIVLWADEISPLQLID